MKAVVQIRAATVEDAPVLAAAEIETAQTPGLLRSRPDELNVRSFAQRIAELEAPGNAGRYIVAVNDLNEIVGHALLDSMSLARIAHVFRLTIVVHPGHADRGVGRALMNDLQRWAHDDSRVEKIELLVRATNARAIHLYRSCGFVDEGRFVNRIKLDNGIFIDDLAMAWFP
ncbi:MAG: N-acetyltransferase [Betaproteobacteria bacterium]|nr:MAG: N-acetyltransferase [Betaproteobacteria bacterium]